jgi:protein transport protein SEC61 subunit gamma-like protein
MSNSSSRDSTKSLTSLASYVRVLKLARKPSDDKASFDEFKQIALVTSGGALVIGLLGFIIFFLMGFIPV